MILSNPYGKSKKGSPFFARAGPRKSGVRALQNKKSYGITWENTSQKKGAMDLQAREKIEYALEQIRKGQDEGVETLYVLMGRTMLFVANGVVRDRHAAEDVVQESFVKIVKGIHSYRAGSNGYAWVCRIVRNTALNDLRKSGGAEEWTVCGSLCTTADVLVKNLPLTGAKEGDVLVFSKAGAYSVTEGISLFLSRPLPRVYQREGDTLTLLRDFIKTSQINQKE